MPKISSHPSSSTTKLLLIGDPGSGKTGALLSLAFAGYNLRIVDLDNGVEILKNLLRPLPSDSPEKVQAKAEAAERIDFITITDSFRNAGGRAIPKSAKAWPELMKTLDNWPGFGPVSSWTPQDVLVLDSMTMAGLAALRYVLQLNARLTQAPYQSDWGEAQALLEGLCQYLYDSSIQCNVIVTSHISFIGRERDENNRDIDPKGFPMTLGRALSPKVGRYFNSLLMIRSTTIGDKVQREILTDSFTNIELKTSAPFIVKKRYSITSGLADYFKDVRG